MARKKGKKKHAAAARAAPGPAGNHAAHVAPLDAATLAEARELQAQELEVLQAIFDHDLILQSATPLYSHIFSIRLRCKAPDGGKKKTAAEALLHFDWARGYPLRQAANIAVEALSGLSDADAQKLTFEMEKLAREKVGDAMVYDLVVCATDFIQEHLKDQSSFFEQMLQHQQDRETQEKQVEDALLQREEELARAKNDEILALIDAERERKRERIKKRNVRRRRHRSSIDGEEDYGSDEGSYSRGEGRSESLSSLCEQPSLEDEDSDGDSSALSDSSGSEPLTPEHLHSRYYCDFKEIGLLGRGGGGEVVKVRNRLDRQLYAVKKIKLDPDDPTMKKKILREVKTISRMQHRHIVRYFQAWIEGDSGLSSDDEDDEEEDDGLSEDSDSDNKPHSDGHIGLEAYESTSLSSDTNDVENSQPSVDDDDDDWLGTMSNSIGLWSTSKHETRSHRSNSQSLSLSSRFRSESSYPDDGFDWEGLQEADDDDGDDGDDAFIGSGGDHASGLFRQKLSPHQIRAKRLSEKLYIQMEYCGGSSLRDIIDKSALWKNPDKIWTLLRQILEAIVYIHRQGIIHRDLKPPNVFLDAEGDVKLGDFGLAVRPPKSVQEEPDDDEDGAARDVASMVGSTGNFLSNSTGSSVAELYGRLKMENLESTRTGIAVQKQQEITTMTTMSDANITAGVGTAFYRAPEQEREGQRYNQKADMFSLGIMFFEMWSPPFTTLMERAQALTGLREQGILPVEFAAPDNVKEIILWLCKPSPASRPNAVELLASSLLPPKMEVEGTYLREALETLANPEGKFFGQLIDALVTQEPVSHVDYTYDHLESIKVRSYTSELRSRTYVKTVLQKIFERHGAIEHTTPLLMPRASEQNFTGVALSTPQSSCLLLDSTGVSVTLPFDLTERLARFVARHNISRLKCYQFDRVYRKNIVGGHPRELIESDFDIIWDDRGSFRFIELEGLEVVAEVMQALSSSLGSYFLRLNDARVTRGILELCHVPSSARRELLKLLSNEVSMRVHTGPASTMAPNLKAGRWKYVAKRMKAYGAPADSVEAIRPFFLLPEDCLTSLDLIEQEAQRLFARNRSHSTTNNPEDGSLPSDALASALMDRKQQQKRDAQLRRTLKDVTEGVASLRVLLQSIEFLRLAGPACFRVDLGLSPRPERYTSGFVFQAILLASNAPTASSSSVASQVIAEGGRYDSLITRFKLPAAYMKTSTVAAMGVRFSIDKIVSCVMGAVSSALLDAKVSPSSLAADVLSGGRKLLVCSAGKASDTTLLRMKMALSLWRQGIGADYLHPEPLHLEDLEDYCAQASIHWMVVVQKHHVKEKNQVKIRAVKNPSEADMVVSVSSLAEVVGELVAGGGAGRGGGSGGGSGGGADYYYSMMGGRGMGSGGGNFFDATNVHGGSGMGGGGTGGGGGGGSEVVGMQPIFDVKVVDGRHQTREGGGRNKNNQNDSHKITRRVSKWIMTSFASRGEEAMKVLSVDLPFALVRELSSAVMAEGLSGLDTVAANNPRYRKQLRYTVEELATLEPTSGRERYVLLHSLVDDRYDMMSLAPATKRKSAGGATARRNL